jgi:hypothetical protein
MSRDRAIADHECAGDLAVAFASRDEAEHFHLSHGEAMSVAATAPCERVNASDIRPRAERNKSVAGGGKLKNGSLRIAERTAGLGQQHASLRHLVRRLEFLPRVQCAPQRKEPALSVTLRYGHGPGGLRGHC